MEGIFDGQGGGSKGVLRSFDMKGGVRVFQKYGQVIF
jgi:hypothetical protein